MSRPATVAAMTLRELTRRRAVFALLFATPLMFYLGRRGDHTGQAIRFVILGLGFTVSTAALFSTVAARSLDPRLRLCGYHSRHLYLGRLLALLAVGTAVAAPYLAIIAVDQRVHRLGAIALALVLAVAVAAPLGMLLGNVVPRELEGALLLVALLGVQMIVDPARTAARLLPFWSTREIGTYAIDLTNAGYLYRGTAHGIVTALGLTALTATLTTLRLRQHHPNITGRVPRP
jgi:hypothetical protein